MFIKSKICFTVFVIYEIIAISLLHFTRTCDAMFSTGFCDSTFKYFAGAVAVPLVAYLIWMWIHEIVRARRRRRFINRAKEIIRTVSTNVHDKMSEISPHVLEQVIAAAFMLGVQRYAAHHPNIKQALNKIIGKSNGDDMDYEYDMDTEHRVASQKRTPRKRAQKSTSATVKTKRTTSGKK